MATIHAPLGTRLFLKAPTGETLHILSDQDQTAPLLNVTLKETKMGGLDTFEFSLPRSFNLPVGINTQCHIHVNNTLWFVGYIKETPLQDQNDPVLVFQGEGFQHRLKSKYITQTYTLQTLDTIVRGIASYLGSDINVFYNVAKIAVPVIADLTVEYKDKNLWYIFDQLVRIANYDYDNAKYRWYVDSANELVFELIPSGFHRTLTEGYQYQNPNVSEDNSKIINKIQTYRSTQGDPKVIQFVATYNDTASQNRYGLFEKKITFADYLVTNIIAKIAAGILARRAPVVEKLEIENYEIDAVLPWGKYYISNKRDNYFFIVSDCDELAEWDLTHLSTTLAVLSGTHVLTGRESIRITVADGSYNEYLEITLADAIPFQQIARTFIYFTDFTPQIELTYYDDRGNSVTITFGILTRQLAVDDPGGLGTDLDLSVDVDEFTEELLEIDHLSGSITDQWFRFERSLQTEVLFDSFEVAYAAGPLTDSFEVAYAAGPLTDAFSVSWFSEFALANVKKVRVTMKTNAATIFYLDRLDIIANNYFTHKLQLEEVEYHLSSKVKFVNAAFGERADNVFSEIGNKVESGDIALAIVEKT